MMKLHMPRLVGLVLALVVAGCSTSRVLVKNCKDIQGDYKECELVTK